MILVQLDRVSKAYGANEILTDISWQINDDARVGLIGPNGCGKTTLARLITGEEGPTTGIVSRARSVAVGYLQQEPALAPGSTVRDHVLAADRTLVDMRARLAELEHRIAALGDEAGEADLRAYGTLHDQYEHHGGYEYEALCEMVLDRLGLGPAEYERPVELLSGGQQSRLELAALLVRRPGLLVLDEPTNHLDIQAIEWLEGFLSSYAGAVIVISHDRAFLDRIVAEVVEIEEHRLVFYPGNYSAYTTQKAERAARREKEYRQQQELIERTEEFIRRNIAGQKTKQAQSRRKMLAKLERLAPPRMQRSVRLSFPVGRRGGNEVLEVRDLSKGYNDLRLFDGLSFTIRRSERVGIVGPNGSGKSTLLRLLVGEEEPDAGSIRVGTGVDAAYFDQRREGLDLGATVIDEVWSVRPALTVEQIRGYLGSFLFSEDEQFRAVGTLSGGEQSRVALAKLILGQINLLILDEPTNHLDIPSRLALEAALERFEGTLIVVSHDRALLRKLTTRILLIEGGAARMHDMGYGALERKLAEERTPARPAPKAEEEAKAPALPAAPSDKAARIAEYDRRRQHDRRRRQRERRWEEIEARIMDLENRLAVIDDQIATPENAADWEKLRDLVDERRRTKEAVDALYEEWAAMERSSRAGIE